MKTLRRQRKYHAKGSQQPRTVRHLECQQQKQEFFQKVAEALHQQFPPQHLQLFLQHLANSLPLRPQHARPRPPTPPPPEEHFRRLDPALFADPPAPLFPSHLPAQDSPSSPSHPHLQPHTSTPKQNRQSACLFTRKLFDVDLRMRRHYERAKQRLCPFAQSHRPNPVRISLAGERSSQGRCSTTQRSVRYKTEQEEGEGVPGWLLGHSISTRHSSSGLRRNPFEQRRMECLVGPRRPPH